jgi:acyl-CoA hydrolase
MDHYKLVLPEHLNHYGSLFGGNLLKWIDEFAYITAKLEFSGHEFVTIALENVEFRQRVGNGEILRFSIIRNYVGNSSINYNVKAFGTQYSDHADSILFETNITFVSVDSAGKKRSLKH